MRSKTLVASFRKTGVIPWFNLLFFFKNCMQICDRTFEQEEADVACRQLHLPLPGFAIHGGVFGESSGPNLLEEIYCNGNETRLDACNHNPWGQGSCAINHAVGVACNASGTQCPYAGQHFQVPSHTRHPSSPVLPPVMLRLVNGTSPNSGRLEMAINNVWGKASCKFQKIAVVSLHYGLNYSTELLQIYQSPGFRGDFNLDDKYATVACRQLGLPTPGRAIAGDTYGRGPVLSWLGEIKLRYIIHDRAPDGQCANHSHPQNCYSHVRM